MNERRRSLPLPHRTYRRQSGRGLNTGDTSLYEYTPCNTLGDSSPYIEANVYKFLLTAHELNRTQVLNMYIPHRSSRTPVQFTCCKRGARFTRYLTIYHKTILTLSLVTHDVLRFQIRLLLTIVRVHKLDLLTYLLISPKNIAN